MTETDLIGKQPPWDLEFLTTRFERIGLPYFMSRIDQPATQIAACCQALGCSVVG
jgi:hypothetical protein